MLLTNISNVSGNCKDGENKGENETNKEKRKKEKEKPKKQKKRKASSSSSSESETNESEEDSEDPTRKQPTRKAKKTLSKKKKVVVEDSSPEQAQYYDGYEIGTQELEEILRESRKKKNNEKSAAHEEKEADLRSTEGHYVSSETMSLAEKSANEPAEVNMMVVQVETQSQTKALSIVPIQICLPLSQTTTVPKIKPTPVPKINEETTKSTPEPPPTTEESTPTLPPAPSKVNPAPEDDVVALMMMARIASYIPKEDLMPSFSLDLTDSSQEEAATQEGERAKTPETPKLIEQVKTEGKTPPIHKQSGEQSFEKFETPARTNEMTIEMKEKCYIWATRVKTYADGNTNEYDNVCTLNAQDKYILSKLHFASLQANTHIEAEIVSAMCLILNQQKIKRFPEEVYCLPPDIMNMAIANHPEGVFINPKTNRPFRVEDYPIFIPFLDLKKISIASLWTCNFKNESICWGAPLKKDDKIIRAPYINISGQKTSYDYAIYDEMNHYRVEYAFRILFHEMNQDKAEAIRGSDAIRLSRPSSLLLSPYCQIDSNDINTD
ncbi:hypothetical protein Ahy_A06g026859 [Arachis hypogaea]|uniref:Uncharacterized protein n=1 Tax=Arachis hypogaea TaxID=3818 RepID=A0A445CLW0_ARAHY|nr:hypothetical protein Ahy_A06g026859 [Arachis hypogaea]